MYPEDIDRISLGILDQYTLDVFTKIDLWDTGPTDPFPIRPDFLIDFDYFFSCFALVNKKMSPTHLRELICTGLGR